MTKNFLSYLDINHFLQHLFCFAAKFLFFPSNKQTLIIFCILLNFNKFTLTLQEHWCAASHATNNFSFFSTLCEVVLFSCESTSSTLFISSVLSMFHTEIFKKCDKISWNLVRMSSLMFMITSKITSRNT